MMSATDWTTALAQILEAYGRQATAEQCRLLNFTENATYYVPCCTTERAPMILRLNRPGYRSSQEVASELAWSEALRREGVISTPAVIPDRFGALVCRIDNQQAIAFEFVDGVEPLQESWVSCFAALGAITARMHRHAEAWEQPEGFIRREWLLDGLLGQESDYGHWSDNPLISFQQRELFATAEAKLRSNLLDYGTDAKRYGLIHNDLRIPNLLMSADGSISIIDFDDCGFSWYLLDLACALSFIETEPEVPAMIEAWLSSYQQQRPLSYNDIAVIPSLIMARRLQMTAWMERRKETPFAAELRDTDFIGGSAMLAERYLSDDLFAASLGRFAQTWTLIYSQKRTESGAIHTTTEDDLALRREQLC
jgi:Ser/Thr protein kinase RdoA (MazF antagonist)